MLGLNGVTAYFALLDVGAAARRRHRRRLDRGRRGGLGGRPDREDRRVPHRRHRGRPDQEALCRDEFGYDAAIDYTAGDLDAALAAACPRGIDVYFDNTAGAISDAVLRHLAVGARVVICGTASVASWDPSPTGPRVERHLLVKRARMQGFIVFDYQHRYEEAVGRLADWVRADSCAIARTSSTASSRRRARSRASTAARTSASGSIRLRHD